MNLNETRYDDTLLVPHCNHAQYEKATWERIAGCRHSYVVEAPQPKFVKFPGFVTDEKEIVEMYDEMVYGPLNYAEEFTPPRGNLTSQLSHIVCGFKPGHALQHLSMSETSWLFGPSSKMLHKVLEDLGIFPYFTNVFKNHSMKYGDILVELEFLTSVFPDSMVVFLGNYDEYARVIYDFAKKDVGLKHKSIWHPAYLARSFTEAKYQRWKKSLKGNRNESRNEREPTEWN